MAHNALGYKNREHPERGLAAHLGHMATTALERASVDTSRAERFHRIARTILDRVAEIQHRAIAEEPRACGSVDVLNERSSSGMPA